MIYLVSKLLVKAVNAMLSFVNEHTRKKFVITDDLDVVCDELGWDVSEIRSGPGPNPPLMLTPVRSTMIPSVGSPQKQAEEHKERQP